MRPHGNHIQGKPGAIEIDRSDPAITLAKCEALPTRIVVVGCDAGDVGSDIKLNRSAGITSHNPKIESVVKQLHDATVCNRGRLVCAVRQLPRSGSAWRIEVEKVARAEDEPTRTGKKPDKRA